MAKKAAPKVKAGSMADKKMEKKMGMKPGSKADMMMEMPKKKMPTMAKGGSVSVAKGKGKWVLPSVPTLPDSNRGSPSNGTSGGISSPAPGRMAAANADPTLASLKRKGTQASGAGSGGAFGVKTMAKGGTVSIAKGKGKWVLPSVPTLPDSGTSGGISSPAPATRAFNSVRPVVLDAMYKRAQDMLGNRVRLPGMKAGGSVKHPGFASVQASIAKKEGLSKDRAGAILAASTRRASASAVKKNPRLKKVKG